MAGKRGVPEDPDKDFNRDFVKEALEQAQRIRDAIKDAPEGIKDRAGDFFESVDQGVASVAETIEKLGRVSERQQNALNNWEAGVASWLAHER